MNSLVNLARFILPLWSALEPVPAETSVDAPSAVPSTSAPEVPRSSPEQVVDAPVTHPSSAEQTEPPIVSAAATVDPQTQPVRAKPDKKVKKKRRKRGSKPRRRDFRFSAPGNLGLEVGWLDGLGTRKVHTPVLIGQGEIGPGFSNRHWDLRLPLNVQYRETFAGQVDETKGGVALRVEHEPLKWFKWGAQGEIFGVWRLDWPDQYQPLPDGSLMPTDRYSYYERRVGAELTVHPLRRHWLDLGYRYRLADYRQDPAFDPVAAPSHLVPSDNERHEAQLFWRWVQQPLKVKAGAEAFEKKSFFYFSRDAHTGSTHAGSGGAPPNPLQKLRGVELQAELTWRAIERKLQLIGGYGSALVDDPFQGYYSSVSHHPWLGISSEPRRHYEIAFRAEAWLLRYGSNSYQAGPGHPPLTSGTRRTDRKLALTLDGSLPVVKQLRATAQIKYVIRDTNFPPYQPGVFPASRSYDIEWNYWNLLATVGLSYSW